MDHGTLMIPAMQTAATIMPTIIPPRDWDKKIPAKISDSPVAVKSSVIS